MKKHKTEFIALSLLLVVLSYAFYESNIRGNEQDIVLVNELFSAKEITSKEDITMEMLSLPEEESKEEVTNGPKEEVTETYSINLEAEQTNVGYNEIVSKEVINYALNFVGNPYVYGGNSLTEGTDCSGFTKLIYGTYGISLPRSALEQSYSGVSVGLDNIMPGDLVFSGYNGQIHHVAIYIGNGELVHALNSNVGIVVTGLYIMPIHDVRRVI